MGDHYCCKRCGQYYDRCVCPSAPPPPKPDFWALKHGKPVHCSQLQYHETVYATRYPTQRAAEEAYPGVIDKQIEDFKVRIAELRKQKSAALKALQKRKP